MIKVVFQATGETIMQQLLMDQNMVSHDLKIEIRHGTAEEEIVKAAQDLHADLIIMSTHGRTGREHDSTGSVTEKVVRSSFVPVLTIKPDRFRSPIGMTVKDFAEAMTPSGKA